MTPQEKLENIIRVLQLDSMSLLTRRMTDSQREIKFNELTKWGIEAVLEWKQQTKGEEHACKNNINGKLPEVPDVKNNVSGHRHGAAITRRIVECGKNAWRIVYAICYISWRTRRIGKSNQGGIDEMHDMR